MIKPKLLFIPAILMTMSLGGLKNNRSINALSYNELMPYVEIGETTYNQGDDDATFTRGMQFTSNGNQYGFYVFISNENIYNSSTNPNLNPYNTYTDTLVFINYVVYKVGSEDANAWTFRLNNELNSPVLINEWKTIRYFDLQLSRYQSTDYFTSLYEFKYSTGGLGQHVLGWNTTPIIGVNNPHTIFGNGLTGIVLPDSINFRYRAQMYGYTSLEMDREYWRGYNNGFNSGNDYGYNTGYQSGLENNDAFEEGYKKGSNDSFLARFDKWIVPAIIIVLIGGGVISIIAMKRRDS